MPTSATLNGVHRYWPDKDWPDLYQMFDELLASVEHHPDLRVSHQISGNGLGYEVDANAPIVEALRGAYHYVVGRTLPLVGGLSVSDVNVIAREAGIPVLGHGTGSTTSHADLEWVEVAGIVRAAKVYLATILSYLGVAED